MGVYYKLIEKKYVVPCTQRAWAVQLNEMRTNGEKHVADDIINGKRISTVWLGLNHRWDDGIPPLIFETMVFNEGNYSDIYCDRYSTVEQAKEGHERAIQWVLNGCLDEE